MYSGENDVSEMLAQLSTIWATLAGQGMWLVETESASFDINAIVNLIMISIVSWATMPKVVGSS